MKLNRIETIDRYAEFKKQGDYISKGCSDCISNRPQEFLNHPFYIFAHKREIGQDERLSIFNQDLTSFMTDPTYMRKYWRLESVPTHRLIWIPRLTKPSAQTNSMLFKSYPPGDNIKVIWMIPDKSMWKQYEKGNLTESNLTAWSIAQYKDHKRRLEISEDDDVTQEEANRIYAEISKNKSKPMT